jgi:hypothetical protein
VRAIVIPGRCQASNYGAHCAPENLEIPGLVLAHRLVMKPVGNVGIAFISMDCRVKPGNDEA